MATTTNGGNEKLEDKAEPIPYPEDDKLGPLGAKVSALYDPVDLRTSLVREFAAAVNDAKVAAGAVDDNPPVAVHEARKALRRARAVLEMISGALPKSERKAVGRAIREARRALSTARDHAVAPETLASLALGAEDRETAKRVLDNAAESLPATAEIRQLVAEAATRAAAQLEAIEAALPAGVTWDVVVDGIGDVYGEARRARRLAKGSKQWFHTWRRRSKELVYQLDLVSKHAGARVAAIHAEIEGVTDTLGPTVDLIMLREFVTTYGQGVSTDGIDHVKTAIDAQLDDLMSDARKTGRDSFSLKPRKFSKRLSKAVRRDLTPLDETDSNGDLAGD